MGKMKEKRYIKRNPYSIEDGLKDVIEKIGEKGVKEATGKGKDTFLKKSNPEHPGTGKTTTLLNKVDNYLKETDPDKIGYFAFTQKAACG